MGRIKNMKSHNNTIEIGNPTIKELVEGLNQTVTKDMVPEDDPVVICLNLPDGSADRIMIPIRRIGHAKSVDGISNNNVLFLEGNIDEIIVGKVT
jgi:hypothetical protein